MNTLHKHIYLTLAIVLLSSALSFYGGARYATREAKPQNTSTTDGVPTNLRQGGTRPRNQASFGGFLTGKILSKNDSNIVVAMSDGGSKIVFVSPLTTITKFVEGAAVDLEANKNVSIAGDANPDGSINAKTIQLRNDMIPPMMRNNQPQQ